MSETTPTDRAMSELRAETTIDAPRQRVWDVLTDFSQMPDWSPELLRMVPLKPGGLRRGQWYLGLNRNRWVFWPSRNVVTTVDPGSSVAWDTKTSGASWVYELSDAEGGTRVVLRRPMTRVPITARIFAGAFLGGVDHHADELEGHMHLTLDRLRTEVES